MSRADKVKNNNHSNNRGKKTGARTAAAVQKNPEELSRLWLIPIAVAIAVVPLITVIHAYDCGLEKNSWFSTGGMVYDFFLYYKSLFLKIIGIIVLFSLAYLIPFAEHGFLKEKKTIAPSAAIGIFCLLSLLSAILAEDKNGAFFGTYEQYEGWFVILAYVVCFYMAFGYIRTKKLIQFLLDVLLIGATVVGVLGTFQAIGLDWIQSNWAKPILATEVASSMDMSNFNIRLNFGVGTSYVTLYNPNYVGSYVGLVLPYAIYLIIRGEKLWRRILACITSITLIVTLLASKSLTGIMGLLAGAVLCAVLLAPIIKKLRPVIFAGLGLAAAGIIGIMVLQPAFLSSLFNGSEHYGIDSMYCEGDTIHITDGDGNKLIVKTDSSKTKEKGWAAKYEAEELMSVTDENGRELSYSVDPVYKFMQIEEDGYYPLKLIKESRPLADADYSVFLNEYEKKTGQAYDESVTSDGTAVSKNIDVIMINDNSFFWMFTRVGDELMIYNKFGRLDNMNKIEKIGFSHSYHFASRRGYIWSRTFPMLTRSIITGVGRDNFILAFPNDDYVGKYYMFYETQSITKPHNMFLQIWSQDGLIALIAFLFLYVLFIVRAFRLCLAKNRPASEKGLSMFSFVIITAVATTSYMVVGMANDSTITTAPIYWIMLGAGYAAEAVCTKKSTL
ncbi:MAG: O-antigen ligase family protein [Eubacterium sp.]|nr:O-antigen ligase family protein [Eubacterium sp.]